MGNLEQLANDILELFASHSGCDRRPAAVGHLLSTNKLSSAGDNKGSLHAEFKTLFQCERVLARAQGSEARDKKVAVDVVGVVDDDTVDVRKVTLL